MYDFTFEDKFCKYFVNLGQLYKEVLVSFNTDKYLPRKTYKISISLFYDEKLVIEKVKKKKTLDQFATECKLSRHSWQLPCKIITNGSIFNGSEILFSKEYKYITTFEFTRANNESDLYHDVTFN